MPDAQAILPVVELPPIHPELGRALTFHEGRPLAGGMWIYLGGIAFAAGVVGSIDWITSLVSGGATLDALFGAIAILAIGTVMLLRSIYLWRQRLGIYEGGFAIHRLTGNRVVRWSEVESAQARSENDSWGHRFVLEVDLRDGGMVTLTDALDRLEGNESIFQNRGGNHV